MLRVGIIGFGKMGMLHGALICGSRKGKIVAICDKTAVMRVGFKRIYGSGVHTYKDAKKMLSREKLDIVIVTTPTFNHEESVLMALEQNCHVFVEKPLAVTARQAEVIRKTAEGKNLVVQVGFSNRFAPTINRGKTLIETGQLGEIKSVCGQMFIGDVFDAHTGWRYKKDLSGGGVLMDFGIHLVDLLIWYCGNVQAVNAKARRIYSKEVEDELCAKIIFANGIEGSIETSWSRKDYRKSYTHVEVEGSKGRMIITDQTLQVITPEGIITEDDTYPDLYDGCFMDIGGILFSRQMQSFLDKINGEEGAGCTVSEGAYVQTVIEALYRSADIHQSVEVAL